MKQIASIILLLSLFSSFTFAQTKLSAEILKKMEEATPKELPQSPVAKKLKSDAEDNGLKGKVKSVTETEEDLTGTWFVKGIKMSSETFFNENGNRVKYIYYDYRGNPSDITVYVYIDGMRVSNWASIKYDYNPPTMLMPGTETPKPVKPADSRYTTRYENKYDDKRRLSESISYRNNGEIISKSVFVYDGNKLEKSWYDDEGKLYSKIVQMLDDKLNVIEHTFVSLNSDRPNTVLIYAYESFDKKGNWTKRTVKSKEENNGSRKSHYIQYRTITYYP